VWLAAVHSPVVAPRTGLAKAWLFAVLVLALAVLYLLLTQHLQLQVVIHHNE
jgi:hypothetical protein